MPKAKMKRKRDDEEGEEGEENGGKKQKQTKPPKPTKMNTWAKAAATEEDVSTTEDDGKATDDDGVPAVGEGQVKKKRERGFLTRPQENAMLPFLKEHKALYDYN